MNIKYMSPFKRKKHTNSSGSKDNLYFYILNGILFTILTNLYGPFRDKFIYRLGGTDFHISLITSLPGLVAALSIIPGILIINSTYDRQNTMSNFFLVSRSFLLLFALTPFFPKTHAATIFVILFSIRQFTESVSDTSLQSFTGDIFSCSERASAISYRNKFGIMAQLLTTFACDYIITNLGTTEDLKLKIYQIFFVFAFIIGLVEIFTFKKLKVCKSQAKEIEVNKKFSFKEAKKGLTKSYCIFLGCSLIYHFGWQMGWPLFSIYQNKYLGADEHWLAIITIVSASVMFFSYKYWNKLISKKGNPFVMAVTTLGMAATPVMYALSPNLYIITVINIATGFFTSGTIVVLLNSLLEAAPEKNRIFYIAIHSTLTNITLFISPFVGNAVHEHFSIYAALCLSAFIRLAGSIAFFIRSKYIRTGKCLK